MQASRPKNIRIRNSEGELLLSRHDKDAPWRITKPLETFESQWREKLQKLAPLGK